MYVSRHNIKRWYLPLKTYPVWKLDTGPLIPYQPMCRLRFSVDAFVQSSEVIWILRIQNFLHSDSLTQQLPLHLHLIYSDLCTHILFT